jgi:hypothetical protein
MQQWAISQLDHPAPASGPRLLKVGLAGHRWHDGAGGRRWHVGEMVGREPRDNLVLGLADASNKTGRDGYRTGAENKSLAIRPDGRADRLKLAEDGVGRSHRTVSPSGGTAP